MPTPAPMMAASEIGVSITRSAPKRCLQALVLAEDAAAADVLAEHDDARVGFHLALRASGAAARRLRRSVMRQRHWPAPVVCTSVKAALGLGPGRGVGGGERGGDLGCGLALDRVERRAPRAGSARQLAARARDRIGLRARAASSAGSR